MNEIIEDTMHNFSQVGDELKKLRVVEYDRDVVVRVVKLYGAMSICIDVLRGLNGEDYISKECNMSIQKMIEKIREYTQDQDYDDSTEKHHERYLALYDHLYCKLYNLVSALKKTNS